MNFLFKSFLINFISQLILTISQIKTNKPTYQKMALTLWFLMVVFSNICLALPLTPLPTGAETDLTLDELRGLRMALEKLINIDRQPAEKKDLEDFKQPPRLGKRGNNVPRLGKRGNNVPRLGKRGDNVPRLGKRVDNVPRLGKRENNVPRLGKRGNNVPRLGKRGDNVPRFGEHFDNLPNLKERIINEITHEDPVHNSNKNNNNISNFTKDIDSFTQETTLLTLKILYQVLLRLHQANGQHQDVVKLRKAEREDFGKAKKAILRPPRMGK